MISESAGLSPSPASSPNTVEFIFGYIFLTHKAFHINPSRQLGGDRGAGVIHREKHSETHPPFAVPISTMTLQRRLTQNREEATRCPLNTFRTCLFLDDDGERRVGLKLPQFHYLSRTRVKTF